MMKRSKEELDIGLFITLVPKVSSGLINSGTFNEFWLIGLLSWVSKRWSSQLQFTDMGYVMHHHWEICKATLSLSKLKIFPQCVHLFWLIITLEHALVWLSLVINVNGLSHIKTIATETFNIGRVTVMFWTNILQNIYSLATAIIAAVLTVLMF